MALSKQKFREILFQLLYSEALSGVSKELISLLMKEHYVTRKNINLVQEMGQRILEALDAMDRLISQHCAEYALERIPLVEKTILRLSIYELLYEQVPEKVVISEAIRLAKKFAHDESSKFINAVLDKVYHSEKRDHQHT